MNITVENFEEHKEAFIKDLNDCDYVAWDLEMSGIKVDDYVSNFDMPFEYYIKHLIAPQKYGVIQIGFSLFKQVDEGVEARTYNFYTFPRPYNGKFTRDVAIEPDCVEFHKKVGTDFQKWIIGGVGYFDQDNLEKIESNFFPADKKDDKEPSPMTRERDIKNFNTFKGFYDKFVAGTKSGFDYGERSGFMRMQYYKYIEKTTPTFGVETKAESGRGYSKRIFVTRLNAEQRKTFDMEQAEKKRQKFQKLIGFTKIWQEVKLAGKPLIGHNCFLDLIFTFDHFNKNLTHDFKSFKKDIHEYFPEVYDTKLLSNDKMIEAEEISSRMCLEELYKHMRKTSKTKIITPPGFEDYTKDGTFHEAGFDAFCTAAAFTYLKENHGQALLDNNVNNIRLHKSQAFRCDLADYENDYVCWDRGFLSIILKEICSTKEDAQKFRDEFSEIYGDFNDQMRVSLQGNSSTVWGENNKFWTLIITFDKEIANEKLNIKKIVKNKLAEMKLGEAVVHELKHYNSTMYQLWHDTVHKA